MNIIKAVCLKKATFKLLVEFMELELCYILAKFIILLLQAYFIEEEKSP